MSAAHSYLVPISFTVRIEGVGDNELVRQRAVQNMARTIKWDTDDALNGVLVGPPLKEFD